MGAYSRRALSKSSQFSAIVFYFAAKREDVPKQNFNCLLKVSLKYLENSVSMEFLVELCLFQ